MSILIEVCVDNPQSLSAALEGGADRIELCSALELGGLTPTRGFIDMAAAAAIPVYAMIRPRGGDFAYAGEELELMEADIRLCADAGLAGVVIGAVRNGAMDVAAMARLIDAARPLGVTLHRAFDCLKDPLRAIDEAAELGIERILTSGGAATAAQGTTRIRSYTVHAGNRLSIMAGCGINAENAGEIVRQSGVSEIHGSFGKPIRTYAPDIRSFGFGAASCLTATDPDLLCGVRRNLNRL